MVMKIRLQVTANLENQRVQGQQYRVEGMAKELLELLEFQGDLPQPSTFLTGHLQVMAAPLGQLRANLGIEQREKSLNTPERSLDIVCQSGQVSLQLSIQVLDLIGLLTDLLLEVLVFTLGGLLHLEGERNVSEDAADGEKNTGG